MDAMIKSLTTLLDARQVSHLLGVRLQRTYELIRSGRIPVVRIGRQVRVDPVALEEWIAGGGTVRNADPPSPPASVPADAPTAPEVER